MQNIDYITLQKFFVKYIFLYNKAFLWFYSFSMASGLMFSPFSPMTTSPCRP